MNNPGNAEFYRSLQSQNLVDEQVIESLGGIEDTLKPLEATLKQHELRPYSVQRNYRRELIRSSRGANPTGSGSSSRRVTDHINQEKIKLVSVSPFRAVVKVEDGSDEGHDSGDDFEPENNPYENE
jgi:hypothetical protein